MVGGSLLPFTDSHFSILNFCILFDFFTLSTNEKKIYDKDPDSREGGIDSDEMRFIVAYTYIEVFPAYSQLLNDAAITLSVVLV